MRRLSRARNLQAARFILFRRRLQRHLPRHPARVLGWGALGILLIAAALGGADYLDRGSRLRTALLGVTAQFGLQVQEVEVEGRHRTPAAEVLQAVGAGRGAPILSVAPSAVRERLEQLAWVRSATVQRRLPNTIFVRMTERAPLALWQRDRKLALIDTEGTVVATDHLERFGDLLLVVGEDAPKHAQELIGILRSEPALMRRVNAAVRVGGRRWNLQMDGGINVELPETGLAEAWAHLADIERAHALLARDVERVDMRLPDRVVVKPVPEPAKPAGPTKSAKSPGKPT